MKYQRRAQRFVSMWYSSLSLIHSLKLPRFRGGHLNCAFKSNFLENSRLIDRQRANSCMCCCPKLTFMLRSKSWLRTPTLAMDIAFGLTVSQTDSINKRILTKQLTVVKILIVTVCNHFQCF